MSMAVEERTDLWECSACGSNDAPQQEPVYRCDLCEHRWTPKDIAYRKPWHFCWNCRGGFSPKISEMSCGTCSGVPQKKSA